MVSYFCTTVIQSFGKDILPSHFGPKTVTWDDLIVNHKGLVARKWYNLKDDQLAVIFDGTYIYHKKSFNNEYQRIYDSGKKTSIIEALGNLCTPDGYIISITGPFSVNKNDAKILRIILSCEYGLKHLQRKGDVLIVDRWFHDIKEYLEKQGYMVLMPALKGNRSKLTTAESNASRKVTKVRWVI